MEKHITLDEDNMKIEDKFAYLGGVLSMEGGAKEAVRSRIRSGWMKFKEVLSVLGNKYMSLKIRGALFKSALTYRGECWALSIEDERRLMTTEMKMLRLICGKTLKDKITN